MSALRQIGAENKMEVWVDGGIRRGSDIFKALALGAKCVGLGRPSLYAMGTYGEEGVQRMIQMLKEELEMCMVMCGVADVKDIGRGMVEAGSLGMHVCPPRDVLGEGVYEPLRFPSKL